MPNAKIRARAWVLPIFMLVLAGCASVDFDYPKTESTAIRDTQNTSLAGDIHASVAFEPGESGFYLLTDGIEALATRLLMAKSAEKSIDAQYYLITNDSIGMAFIISSAMVRRSQVSPK